MLVEFIGSTGAGKTTLLNRLEHRLINNPTITSTALVTRLVGLRRVTHPTAQNLIQEIVGFPFFVSALYQHRAFLACTMRLLQRAARPGVVAFNNVRSLERKLGVYTLARRIAGDRIVLVDEGPLQAAHMLVHGGKHVSASDVAAFARTVPLPDAIVYVRASVDAIVMRTLLRPDPPREMPILFCSGMCRYAEAAATLFDQLVACLHRTTPVLVVDNPDGDEQRREALVDSIATFIIVQRANSSLS